MAYPSYDERMFRAYVECALWSSVHYESPDSDGVPMDDLYGEDDISDEALQSMRADCEAFSEDNERDLMHVDAGQAGHDFWLTRNHHGAGFWDRGNEPIWTRLTDAAHAYGECDLYVGDDGKVYVS